MARSCSRATPDGPEAHEVHAKLADAYERAGNYERALMHYRATADPEPEAASPSSRASSPDHLLEDAQALTGRAAPPRRHRARLQGHRCGGEGPEAR